MVLQDKNLTLEPPEGFVFQALDVQGAFFRAEYWQPVYSAGTTIIIGHNKVAIYTNSMGREVMRTTVYEPEPLPEVIDTITRWDRFRNGWIMVLVGIGEMFKCLKS